MTDHDEVQGPSEPPPGPPPKEPMKVEVTVTDAERDDSQNVKQPTEGEGTERPSVALIFTAPDSAAFHFHRNNVSAWQLLIAAGHIQSIAELELRQFHVEGIQKAMQEQAKAQADLNPPRRGVREIFKGGRWKPPAERK